MSKCIQVAINGRLSLRPPQAQALDQLVRALKLAPELLHPHARDNAALLARLSSLFPTLHDFERDFPSLCFALATGVGKTRLMGACIAYLHLAHGINNFLILAPNLTIYNKLINDFSPNHHKYVFKGIAEFASYPPLIISGDNYEQSGATAAIATSAGLNLYEVRINIFNIAKLSAEMRGGKEPRIKRLREVLGESYFNHLANLPDLVLLMDESHRYRAVAGMRTINELNPRLGLELTATPFVETNRGPVAFKNVVLDYPLARALEDGFIKQPAVVTQRNFDASAHSAAEIEQIKLEDGIRLHEITKVELLTYARSSGLAAVKPFVLVIARDTQHASQLKTLLESSAFYQGRYQGKVIQVDSSRSGAEEEHMISRLLAVEQAQEPTEIVIHVNMLKEGWDVTNLYTIIPLRAANARTLIEQSIGRGLRLPYGQRTGVEAVDRLNIVAHDKFQEIIDEANRGDSVLRLKQVILEPECEHSTPVSLQIQPYALNQLGIGTPLAGTDAPPAVFTQPAQQQIAQQVAELVSHYEAQPQQVPTRQHLLQPHIQAQLVAAVREQLQPQQGELLATLAPQQWHETVHRATEVLIAGSIDIPRIIVVPSGEVSSGFHPFSLDVSRLYLQPSSRELLIQNLHTHAQTTIAAQLGTPPQRCEDYLVHALLEYDDIDYQQHADLLYQLAGQLVQHLRSYLNPSEVQQVLQYQAPLIAKDIHTQMLAHFWESVTRYSVTISRGFTQLKPCNYTLDSAPHVHSLRDTLPQPSRIKQLLFGGLQRCLYPLQKFDSDSERRLAVILERDALKWFKPVKGQLQIYYQFNHDQPEYLPDFIVETAQYLLMIEVKARNELDRPEVHAKAAAAQQWCQHASDYHQQQGAKPWCYLLIPHDEINEAKRLEDFLRFRSVQS